MSFARAAPVFAGLTDAEIDSVTQCLGVQVRDFDRGETLVAAGTGATSVGLVLEGSVFLARVDAGGTRHLVDAVATGGVFGEDILFHDAHRSSEYTVTAAMRGRALVIGMDKIVRPAGALCELRSRVVENLFHVMAAKNRSLQRKIAIVATKSLRERIMLFLAQQARLHGSRQFTILFSRAELAEYLNADRTALSRELARMRKAHLIDFHRNSFSLLV